MNKIKIHKMRLLRLISLLAMTSIILTVVVSVEATFETKPGVVPLGMGGAYVSQAEGSNAIFWNPAGLGYLKKAEISMVYGKEYVGLDSDNLSNWYAGLVYPLGDYGAVGIGELYFNSEVYKENTGIISFGRKFGEISTGINFKVLSVMYSETGYTKTDPIFMANGMSKTRISIDAGIIYKATDELSIGDESAEYVIGE